jgi:hypothetical protein
MGTIITIDDEDDRVTEILGSSTQTYLGNSVLIIGH